MRNNEPVKCIRLSISENHFPSTSGLFVGDGTVGVYHGLIDPVSSVAKAIRANAIYGCRTVGALAVCGGDRQLVSISV